MTVFLQNQSIPFTTWLKPGIKDTSVHRV